MRKILILAVSLTVLGSVTSNAAELSPDWSHLSAADEQVLLSAEVREQPVVLFFWATWCPYCKALMPHLQSIRLEYGDRVKILAINFREKGDPVAYIEERAYDFTVLPGGEDIAALYEVWGTPGVLIVNGQREIAFDLRSLPAYESEQIKSGHVSRASYLAPYWAAAIRESLDSVLAH